MENQSVMVDTTKERLLAVAEKLFAEKGFNGVSVREITQSAECNLASVNYYFGNKKSQFNTGYYFPRNTQPDIISCRRLFVHLADLRS